ncbi:MAG: chorismate mutase [Cyanobacteria bacterium P01_A01_bin.114]
MENVGSWRVCAIRGATTIVENSKEAIQEAVDELLTELEHHNQLDPANIISATFSATQDIDAIFPAAIARRRPKWDSVALLDVQQMHVDGSLPLCIRFLIHAYLPVGHSQIYHPYLREAKALRPDWCIAH